ncbi:MAG: EI24 domain-containing protein [Planctomycetes bacterium]|nr:EI24 domain-containing protein [Planctomycetota bacterium]
MTTNPLPCACCGHAVAAARCDRCDGQLRTVDGRHSARPGRGLPPLDFVRGVRDAARAPFALLFGREFVGRLRLPVVANALVSVAIAIGLWLVLAPAFTDTFAEPWGVLEGLRRGHEHTGPALWLLTCWVLLGPSLLDVAVGALHEPLRLAAERTMLGPRAAAAPPATLRLTERARVLGYAFVALPPTLLLVLVPWVGIAAMAAIGAAVAALVWFEPPMAARGLDLRGRIRLLWRNRWRALGTGVGIQLAAAVPFVNLLALAGVATVAATSSYLQFDKQR